VKSARAFRRAEKEGGTLVWLCLPEGGELREEERVGLERHERELVQHAIGDGQSHHCRRRRGGGRWRGAHRTRQGYATRLFS